MWREQNEALGSERPSWTDVVDGFLLYAETGFVDVAEVRREMQQLYLGLLVAREISDFGVLQAYLHEKDAVLQLSAKPFDVCSYPALACVDPINGTPRQYAIEICQGAELGRLCSYPLTEPGTHLSHDVLEMVLRRDTGIVIPSKSLKYAVQALPDV